MAVVALTACGSSNTGRDITHPASTTAAVTDTPSLGPVERCDDGLVDIEDPVNRALRDAPADPTADLAEASAALRTNPLEQSSAAQEDGQLLISRTRTYVQLARTTGTTVSTAEGLNNPVALAYKRAQGAEAQLETDCANALS